MKKWLIAGVIVLVLSAGAFAYWRMAGEGQKVDVTEVSPRSAASLQAKLDVLKQNTPDDGSVQSRSMEVHEAELESYVLFSMKDSIPVQLDKFEVSLETDTVTADAQVTIPSGGGGIVDAVLGGTHNLLIKGRMVAADQMGKFDLEDIRIDGIPVPRILIETLFDRYVTPKYPDADLKEPFSLPWGMKSIKIMTGKALIEY